MLNFPAPATKQATPLVLLIDDSPSELRLLLDLVRASVMRLIVALNGQDGLDKAVLHQPDLILMDVQMPGMDGFAACRLLKAQARTQAIPVIFLTAANDLESRLRGLTLGGVDYISKPFNEHEVMARIRIHLDLSRRLRQTSPAAELDLMPDTADNDPAVMERRNGVLVRAATAYLREHLATPPSPEALARLVGANEKRLNQAFIDCYDLPVFGWLREERMRQACELLTNTDTAIASIGDYLGFSSAANFAKAFRERFGMSPRALRHEQLQQQQQRQAGAGS
jgi:DNA-binding response OmpR family regulator